MSLVQEFRDFAVKGNAIELAVGVIIGSAFGKIVTSLVEDILLPFVALIGGKVDFTNYFIGLNDAANSAPTLAVAKTLGPVIAYGSLITILVNFILVAGAVFFFIVKPMNKLRNSQKKDEKKEDQKPQPVAQDVLLLTEIRDLLQKNSNNLNPSFQIASKKKKA